MRIQREFGEQINTNDIVRKALHGLDIKILRISRATLIDIRLHEDLPIARQIETIPSMDLMKERNGSNHDYHILLREHFGQVGNSLSMNKTTFAVVTHPGILKSVAQGVPFEH